jgi:hypothetical protein
VFTKGGKICQKMMKYCKNMIKILILTRSEMRSLPNDKTPIDKRKTHKASDKIGGPIIAPWPNRESGIN